MSEWIKCTDHMPQDNDDCWIFPVDGEVESATFREKMFCEHGDRCCSTWLLNEYMDYFVLSDTVTHWQPMIKPEPPDDIPFGGTPEQIEAALAIMLVL